MNKDNVVFIGMPSVGKSTVGIVVAKLMGYDFIDTDLLIQKQEKRLLKDIIAEEGRARFLAIENKLNSNLEASHSIISPGGSAIYGQEAMKHFKDIATVVYLKVSFEEICRRVGDPVKRGVVLRPGQTLEDLYMERTALFEQYADITIDEENKSMEETVVAVLQALGWA
ncbi:MAG: shikimate kinase [Dorea sp.]|nr:shikimate kinase [Dorea sp.]